MHVTVLGVLAINVRGMVGIELSQGYAVRKDLGQYKVPNKDSCANVCVCVCVCERERDSVKGKLK